MLGRKEKEVVDRRKEKECRVLIAATEVSVVICKVVSLANIKLTCMAMVYTPKQTMDFLQQETMVNMIRL